MGNGQGEGILTYWGDEILTDFGDRELLGEDYLPLVDLLGQFLFVLALEGSKAVE